ncbi:uncharacterized protein LOC130755874 [Actinidia eriantha]|uniref:uncharacterized protein LOC130755874 n=1 Tax=Actinidia eriantha TaxID=165200 RepID=UPI00258ABAFA|nr:uncharacterized protein LOC130755874 [Actinidia eriantha]
MALLTGTHHFPGSYATFPSRPVSWNRGIQLKRLHMLAKAGSPFSLRCKSRLSVRAPLLRIPKLKSLSVSAFKGNDQNEESGGRASGSKSAKKSVKLSYVQQGSEEALTESANMQDVPPSYASEEDEKVAGSLAVQKLFKNWLTLLRTQPLQQVVDESLERTGSGGKLATLGGIGGMQKKERGEILKAAWCYFSSLDATITVPLLILIPSYLAVNVVYGAEVSKDLTPVWFLGPLIVAFYVKILQVIWALYIFSFKQTVKVAKSVPTYCIMAYTYIACGKLKQQMLDIKNFDYKALSKRKMKEFEEWADDKYKDLLETIWPRYCRTIRFLKRAKLI